MLCSAFLLFYLKKITCFEKSMSYHMYQIFSCQIAASIAVLPLIPVLNTLLKAGIFQSSYSHDLHTEEGWCQCLLDLLCAHQAKNDHIVVTWLFLCIWFCVDFFRFHSKTLKFNSIKDCILSFQSASYHLGLFHLKNQPILANGQFLCA